MRGFLGGVGLGVLITTVVYAINPQAPSECYFVIGVGSMLFVRWADDLIRDGK